MQPTCIVDAAIGVLVSIAAEHPAVIGPANQVARTVGIGVAVPLRGLALIRRRTERPVNLGVLEWGCKG